jgi:hypothetical protein
MRNLDSSIKTLVATDGTLGITACVEVFIFDSEALILTFFLSPEHRVTQLGARHLLIVELNDVGTHEIKKFQTTSFDTPLAQIAWLFWRDVAAVGKGPLSSSTLLRLGMDTLFVEVLIDICTHRGLAIVVDRKCGIGLDVGSTNVALIKAASLPELALSIKTNPTVSFFSSSQVLRNIGTRHHLSIPLSIGSKGNIVFWTQVTRIRWNCKTAGGGKGFLEISAIFSVLCNGFVLDCAV